MAKDLKRQFSKKDIPGANKHVKRCSLLLAIRKIKTLTIVSHQENKNHNEIPLHTL